MAKPVGRPPKEIDESRLEALASRMCTNEEMAAELGCSDDTLVNNFSEVIKRGKGRARVSLRAKQFESAMGTPAVPAVYLREHQHPDGRQYGDLVRDEKGRPILIQPAQEAVKPNITMQIFLGKQYLDQSDRLSWDSTGDGYEFTK